MSDNKPLTAVKDFGDFIRHERNLGETVCLYREFYCQDPYRLIHLGQSYGDYREAHAQWPPGRPISEYRPEMGEVLVGYVQGHGFELSNLGRWIIKGPEDVPAYDRFWLLPGTEGA